MTPQDGKVFKLVFSTNGDFLHAEGPDGKIANKLKTIKEMNAKVYKLGIEKEEEEELVSFRDLLHLRRKDYTVKLIDVPGHTICGCECGGVACSWC